MGYSRRSVCIWLAFSAASACRQAQVQSAHDGAPAGDSSGDHGTHAGDSVGDFAGDFATRLGDSAGGDPATHTPANRYLTTFWSPRQEPSDAYLRLLAERFHAIMTTARYDDALRSFNPNIELVHYSNPVFSPASADYDEAYYAHAAASTNPDGRVMNAQFGTHLMDLASENWRAVAAREAASAVTTRGLDLVLTDDCGPNVLPRLDFTPDGFDADAQREHIRQTVSAIKQRVPATVRVIFNGLHKGPAYADWDRAMLDVADGGVREGFVFSLASNTWLPEQHWVALLDRMIADAHTELLVAQAKVKKPNGEAATADERMFAFTSYLLIRHPNVAYQFEDWALVTGYDDTKVQYYPEMDLDLGAALANETHVGGYRDATTGVYARPFEHALVLVNPRDSSATVALSGDFDRVVPSGGGVVDPGGEHHGEIALDPIHTSIDIPAQGGAILIPR